MSFPLPQLLPESHLPTHPTSRSSFLLIISYKTKTTAKQENQNNLKKKLTLSQKKKRKKCQNKTLTQKWNKNTKTSMGSILCWQLLDMGPDVWLINPASLR